MKKSAELVVPPEVEELVNQIGGFIQYWGFKNVQGRIWAHLYMSSTPLDAADLMKRLGISKALVSISIKEMIDFDVIQEAGKSERGTTLYRANPEQEKVILNVLRRRERLMLSRISAAHKLCNGVGKKERDRLEISDENLKKLGEMIHKAESILDLVLQSDTDASGMLSMLSHAK